MNSVIHLVSIAATVVALTAATVCRARDDELTGFLVKQNEVAFSRIQDASFNFTWTSTRFDRSGKSDSDTKSGRVIVAGERMFSLMERTIVRRSPGGDELAKVEQRAVVSDGFSATWQTDQQIASRFDHESVENMPEDERDQVSLFAPPRVSVYGFGDGERTLAELYANRVNQVWTSNQGEGAESSFYFLNVYAKAADVAKSPRRTYVLDGSHGFLIRELRVYRPNGLLAVSHEVEHTAVKDGVWHPVRVKISTLQASQHAHWSGDPNAKHSEADIHISDLTVNNHPSAEVFSIDALGLGEDNLLFSRRLDGSHETIAIKSGEQIPFEVSQQMEHAIRVREVDLEPSATAVTTKTSVRFSRLQVAMVIALGAVALAFVGCGIVARWKKRNRRPT